MPGCRGPEGSDSCACRSPKLRFGLLLHRRRACGRRRRRRSPSPSPSPRRWRALWVSEGRALRRSTRVYLSHRAPLNQHAHTSRSKLESAVLTTLRRYCRVRGRPVILNYMRSILSLTYVMYRVFEGEHGTGRAYIHIHRTIKSQFTKKSKKSVLKYVNQRNEQLLYFGLPYLPYRTLHTGWGNGRTLESRAAPPPKQTKTRVT